MSTQSESPIADPTMQTEAAHGLGPVGDLRAFAVGSGADVQYSYDSDGHLVGILEHFGPGSVRFTPLRPPLDRTRPKGSVVEPAESQIDEHPMKFALELPADVRGFFLDRYTEAHELPNDVIMKAVSLYKLATDAKRGGLKIAVVDQDWQVDHEITGF